MNKSLLLHSMISFLLGCRAFFPKQPSDPIPTHESIEISSIEVGEQRTINIWTPPQYEQGSDPLPVLDMPDGGIREDFPHIANTLAQLIESKSIPPHILVGIENTERGRDLTGASQVEEHAKYGIPMDDGAKAFRAFITKELMTEIGKRYRISETKGIIGESLAGLFVMETFFLEPEAFDFYIAMDPSLWWNGNYLVSNADSFLQRFSDHPIRLWFAGSNATDISIYTHQLAGLLSRSSVEALTWKYSDEPNEKHHTIFRATKEKAMIWAMQGR